MEPTKLSLTDAALKAYFRAARLERSQATRDLIASLRAHGLPLLGFKTGAERPSRCGPAAPCREG